VDGLAQSGFDKVAEGSVASVYASTTYAALDLGTNNCRLLIARPTPEGFRVIDAFSRIVRLGEGLTRSDRLSAPAMARTLAALKVCGSKIRRRGVTAVRAVATEACRRAVNCSEFIDLVERETGIDLEIISPTEEGRLALAGCSPLLNPLLPYALVFDIGGGSTELMWLQRTGRGRPQMIDQISVGRGVVNLTERYGSDRISPADYHEMVAEVAQQLAPFVARSGVCEALALKRVQILGTSGTVTTLAGVHRGLTRYDRGQIDGGYLTVAQALAVTRRLLALDFAGRAAVPCVGRERADVVIAGCAVFEAICSVIPFDQLRVADRGLREGILADFVGRE